MTDVEVYFSFMYTGRLEFRTELHKRLYTTAQQMNMTVLTKLLDAQNAATSPQVKPVIRRPPQIPITYNLQGKKIIPKQIDADLPETLPGRKYVILFNPLACSLRVFFLTHCTAQGEVLCNCFFYIHIMYRKILEVWEQTAEDFDEFISRNPGHFAFCTAPKLGFALLLYTLVFLSVKIPYSVVLHRRTVPTMEHSSA